MSDDTVLLLLNEVVAQLAVSSDPAVGGASVRLILLMANQQKVRVRGLLLSFRGQWSFASCVILFFWSVSWHLIWSKRSEVRLCLQVWTAC